MAAIPLNSEKETLVPVRTKETVSAIDHWVTEEIGQNEGLGGNYICLFDYLFISS